MICPPLSAEEAWEEEDPPVAAPPPPGQMVPWLAAAAAASEAVLGTWPDCQMASGGKEELGLFCVHLRKDSIISLRQRFLVVAFARSCTYVAVGSTLQKLAKLLRSRCAYVALYDGSGPRSPDTTRSNGLVREIAIWPAEETRRPLLLLTGLGLAPSCH